MSPMLCYTPLSLIGFRLPVKFNKPLFDICPGQVQYTSQSTQIQRVLRLPAFAPYRSSRSRPRPIPNLRLPVFAPYRSSRSRPRPIPTSTGIPSHRSLVHTLLQQRSDCQSKPTTLALHTFVATVQSHLYSNCPRRQYSIRHCSLLAPRLRTRIFSSASPTSVSEEL